MTVLLCIFESPKHHTTMIELSDYQKTELNRACELAAAPSTHLRPRLYPDGDMWCALYGENLQDGLAGFGKTPEGAMADFDYNFRCQTLGQNAGLCGGDGA
jgi:hypothetical protein